MSTTACSIRYLLYSCLPIRPSAFAVQCCKGWPPSVLQWLLWLSLLRLSYVLSCFISCILLSLLKKPIPCLPCCSLQSLPKNSWSSISFSSLTPCMPIHVFCCFKNWILQIVVFYTFCTPGVACPTDVLSVPSFRIPSLLLYKRCKGLHMWIFPVLLTFSKAVYCCLQAFSRDDREAV